MNPTKVAIKIERGRWRTRDGLIAIVNKRRPDGKWAGWIPGRFNRTFWDANGKHNLMTAHDLIERIWAEPGAFEDR
jgi:hypothetical protein